jgi:hypothetical protein
MFIDEKRGVSSEDNLTIGLLREYFEDVSQMTLVLWMEVKLWFINENHSSYTVTRDNIFYHANDGLLT